MAGTGCPPVVDEEPNPPPAGGRRRGSFERAGPPLFRSFGEARGRIVRGICVLGLRVGLLRRRIAFIVRIRVAGEAAAPSFDVLTRRGHTRAPLHPPDITEMLSKLRPLS